MGSVENVEAQSAAGREDAELEAGAGAEYGLSQEMPPRLWGGGDVPTNL